MINDVFKGIDVTIYNKTQTGEDSFGEPIFEETAEVVPNVLVGSPTEEEVLSNLNLTGRRAAYVLGIPKGDTHHWENVKVSFELCGETIVCKTIGMPIMGIDELVPGGRNKKVRCEYFNGEQN